MTTTSLSKSLEPNHKYFFKVGHLPVTSLKSKMGTISNKCFMLVCKTTLRENIIM